MIKAQVFYAYFGTEGYVQDNQGFFAEAGAREEFEFRKKSCVWVALEIDGVLVEEFGEDVQG